MGFHIQDEETLDRAGLERLQRRKLASMLDAILPTNEFYRGKLGGIDFDAHEDPLDALPFTTRAEIQQDQVEHPTYGSVLTYPASAYHRLHQTSGSAGVPLRWLDTPESWAWWKRCWGIIYAAAGVTCDDRFFFPFTFGPFIGFWGAFEAAVDLEYLSLPAGGMTTKARLDHLLDHRATFVCCTPTYALRMVEVACEAGIDLASSAVRGLIVAGEPGGNIPATRAKLEAGWGARVFDHPGMTEMGPWGFECVEAPGGLHAMESEFIVELIDPDSGAPVSEGEIGELVLTNLGRWCSPLIRYRTGDRARLIRRRCACGRWFAWVDGGILGRGDDMLVIRGNNVFPSAVEGIVREFTEVAEFRIEVDDRGAMAELTITIEPGRDAKTAGLSARIVERIRDRLHFAPRVSLVDPGTLPRFEMKARRLSRTDATSPD